jgi:ribonuclease Z
MYSSWCYHKPTRSLFDAGEGIAEAFRNHIFGIENVYISHQHSDHIYGLPGLIGSRNSARGTKDKPLNVYYPLGNYAMLDMIDFIHKRMANWLKYELRFIPINENFVNDIGNNREIRAIDSKHQKNALTLLYKIVENRSRLKPEYQGKNIPDLIKSGVDKNSLNEKYAHVEFAYLLDSCGFDYSQIQNASEVVIDCTFLKKEDRDDMTHFCLEECVEICTNANVKNVTLAHISPRYSYDDVKKVQKSLPENYKIHHSIYKDL